jgi:hypothetical protein
MIKKTEAHEHETAVYDNETEAHAHETKAHVRCILKGASLP